LFAENFAKEKKPNYFCTRVGRLTDVSEMLTAPIRAMSQYHRRLSSARIQKVIVAYLEALYCPSAKQN
jgi:hypothetical protein